MIKFQSNHCFSDRLCRPGLVTSVRKIVDIFPQSVPESMPSARIVVGHHARSDSSRKAGRVAYTELVEEILSNTFASTGASLHLSRRPTGSPCLRENGERSELKVSVSHCDNWIAVGVTPRATIGVDIEQIRPRPRMNAISEFLGWSRAPMESAEFWARWTLWEAYAKCMGHSVLQKENHMVESFAAHTAFGRVFSSDRQVVLCDRIDNTLVFSVVISGNLHNELAHREPEQGRNHPWQSAQ